MKTHRTGNAGGSPASVANYSSAGMTGVLVIMSVERDFLLAGFYSNVGGTPAIPVTKIFDIKSIIGTKLKFVFRD